MQCSTAIAAAPGRECQDYVLTGPDWVVLLDGATPYPGLDSGCVHGVRWYVRRLAGVLAEALSTDDKDRPLPELLADAISATCAAHGDCCDLSNVDSPSSTVALLRWTEQRCDALVLADSPILLDTADGLVVVEDPRIDQLPAYDVATVSRLRNADGGF